MSQLTFAPIPNDILRRTDLSHGAKLCCAWLIQYANKDGQAFPKLKTLGEELGCSPRNVQRCFIAELEDRKLLVIQQRGRGQSNIYHVDKSILIHSSKLTTTNLSTRYKGRKEHLKKEIEKITADLVHNMRMPR